MKKTRKMLAMLLSMMLVAVVAIGGTYAYLTSTTEVVKNTFTVGKVGITLDEAKVTEYGVKVEGDDRVHANEYKLLPGHTYVKDPTVHVTNGSEDCWIFVSVENGIAGNEGTNTIAGQLATNGWTAVNGAIDGVYAYKEIVEAGDNINVFGSFTLSGTANVAALKDASIKITAYAVQADGFDSAADAWASAPLAAWVPATQG